MISFQHPICFVTLTLATNAFVPECRLLASKAVLLQARESTLAAQSKQKEEAHQTLVAEHASQQQV